MITMEKAKKLNLRGSDTFCNNHIYYINFEHQIWFAIKLNYEAYKILKDSILIEHCEELYKDCTLNNRDNREDTPLYVKYINNFLLDNVKIALAMELHLKARLIEKGYIIHYINAKYNSNLKALKKKQEKEPISIAEFFNIEQYMYDEVNEYNVLTGLKETSLEFSHILKNKSYVEKLNISDRDIPIIDDIRRVRNTIHLPGDFPSLSYIDGDKNERLFSFINENIVDNTNKRIKEKNLRFPELEKFNFKKA
ncbi:hypothetical protein ACOAOT_25010 [Lacrimispora sp. AGF001]|uniref:hypothetical protein n=1 Tax=Lacrimispora sp. AGF001 TaxID=3401631 RepID=UPI003B430E0E